MEQSSPLIHHQWLGLQTYSEGLKAQFDTKTNAASRLAFSAGREAGCILGLEHSSVITLGKRGDLAKDLFASEKNLSDQKIEVVRSTRGGQATLHSPGQLVIYPIVHLPSLGLGARAYVELLTSTTLAVLKGLSLPCRCGASEPGIYAAKGKIAFFGVSIQKGWTGHGVAISISNDLSLFQLIRSCGVSGEKFSSLTKEGIAATPKVVFDLWVAEFARRHPLDPDCAVI